MPGPWMPRPANPGPVWLPDAWPAGGKHCCYCFCPKASQNQPELHGSLLSYLTRPSTTTSAWHPPEPVAKLQQPWRQWSVPARPPSVPRPVSVLSVSHCLSSSFCLYDFHTLSL